ncbi:MAG: hypothetical protein IMY76_04345 [Chloroflexi bacterium]|nr:hypothetical protein [Chloroflexota bacterium]
MAKSKRINTKNLLLAAFLTISLTMIALIWVSDLQDDASVNPGFYRNTLPPNEAFYLTRTAEFHNYELGTPQPNEIHNNGGGSQGGKGNQDGEGGQGGDHDEDPVHTPTPTIDWDAQEQDV